MTRVILQMMGGTQIVFSIIILAGWLAGKFDLEPVAIMLALDIVTGAGWWLARLGRWRFGSLVAPALMFALGLYGSYFVGLATSFVLFYALAVLLAALLHGGKAPWVMSLLCVLTHLGVGLWRDVHYRDDWVSIALTLSGAFLGISLLQWFVAQQVEQALSQARAELAERRLVEQDLRASRMLFQSLLDSLPLNVYSKDVHGRFIFANRRYGETQGRAPEEIVGKTDRDFHPPELAAKYLQDDWRVIETGQAIEIEEQHQPLGKEMFYVQVIKTPLRDIAGRMTGTLGIFWDITERKRAEEERARLTAILESTSDLVSMATPDAKLTYLNAAGRQMVDWGKDESLVGRVIADLHPPWALEKIAHVGIPTALEKGIWEGETAILRRDGSEIPVSQVILALRSSSGELQSLAAIMRNIAERKWAEEALRQERNLVARIMETSPVGIIRVDRHGQITFANPHAERVLGLAKTEIAQLAYNAPEWRITDFDGTPFPDEQLPFRQVMRTGAPVRNVQHAIAWPDGQRVFLSINATPLFDESGQLDGMVAILEDITERQQAELALQTSEDRFRSLVQNLYDVITVHNLDGTIAYASSSSARVLGYEPDSLIGENPFAFIHPDDQALVQQALAEVAAQSNPGIPTEFRFRRPSGEWIYLESLGKNLLDHPGIRGLVITSRDITERKRAEAILRRYADENARLLRAERQHRELAETLREVGATLAATLDADIVLDRLLDQVERVVPHDVANVMIIEGASVRIVRSRGYEKYGIDIQLAYAPHPFADVPNLIHMAETGEPLIVADVLAAPDWVRRSELSWRRSYAGVPIRARGKAIGFINVSSSTPRYYTQEHAERLRAFADQAAIALENARLFAAEQQRAAELARALDQQRELDRLQREFIQNVSHELRTPLALIRGHAEVLDSGWLGELTPEQKDSLGVIVRRAQMLGKLVEDIVAILAAERREYKRETVDLAVLVRTTVADFEPNAVKSDLRLLAQVAPNVPSVSGDPLALRRVLDNLLGNAFKFTSPGGQVAVRLRQEEGAIVLQVADTGVGIPPDKLGRVFERFYQVDGSSTRQYGGVGLGLALVKEIVEAHRGQITATSQVGAGTTFTLSFPIE